MMSDDFLEGLINTTQVGALPASTWLLTVICIFMSPTHSLTQSQPELANTQSPTCVCLALTSAILLSWALAACHPTGAPTWGALKCRGPPTWRKQYCRCMSRQGPGGGSGVCQDERRCCGSPAVYSASPTPRKDTGSGRVNICCFVCLGELALDSLNSWKSLWGRWAASSSFLWFFEFLPLQSCEKHF